MNPENRSLIAALVLSAAGLVGIAVDEGYTSRAVPDPVKGTRVPTIGFGTTGGVKMGDSTTPVKALARALTDVRQFEGALKRCVKVPLHQYEYDAYVNLAYNIGPGKSGVADGFCESARGGPSMLVQRLNALDYAGACDAILMWHWVGTGSITTQQSLCEYMDDWIMEVILGQSPRGKGGGALAAASNEREDVRVELSQADSDLLSETINSTLLKWFCEYNGLSPCRVYRVIKKDEDLKAASETDKNVSSMGFRMTLEGVRIKYGEHWEEATAPEPVGPTSVGQAVVDSKQHETDPPAAGDDKAASFAEPAAPAQPDALDKLIDAEQAQWQPAMEAMLDPIRSLLADAAARGQTAAELLERLPALLAKLDADPLADSLTRAAFTARLAADAGIDIE